jgi:predicted aspartyl protease
VSESRVTSERFPYLPVQIQLGDIEIEVDALLDTGFDGQVIIPTSLVPPSATLQGHQRWYLADGSRVFAPFYRGTAHLPGFEPVEAAILVLGESPIVGRELIASFGVYLDHDSE